MEGTLGEAPDAIVLVQSAEDAKHVSLPADRPLAYITQTTLSVDETNQIVAVLRRRFPHIEEPAREDICYATSNRQWAVKELLEKVDLLLVVGSRNSSNSERLVDVARAAGVDAYLVDDLGAIDERWLDGRETVGLTSGASAPERLVGEVCDWFVARGAVVSEHAPVHEDVELQAAGRAAPRRAPQRRLGLLDGELAADADLGREHVLLDPARRARRRVRASPREP